MLRPIALLGSVCFKNLPLERQKKIRLIASIAVSAAGLLLQTQS